MVEISSQDIFLLDQHARSVMRMGASRGARSGHDLMEASLASTLGSRGPDHHVIEHFTVWVDGKPQPTQRRLVVKLDDGSDISTQFAALGWSAQDVVGLMRARHVPEGKRPLPAAWYEDGWRPRFTMSEYFVWQQRFPAGASVSIRHSDKPSLSNGNPQSATTLIGMSAPRACAR